MNMTRHPDWRDTEEDYYETRPEHDADSLTVGDTVIWRGGHGTAMPREAVVNAIEVVVTPGDKYGVAVESVPWAACTGRGVIIDLVNGHWCYGEQVSRA